MKIISNGMIFLIRCYQVLFSFRRPCCRFIPSCSHYAIEAIQKHGCLRGGILAIKRILRCRPGFKKYSNCGYDPVP